MTDDEIIAEVALKHAEQERLHASWAAFDDNPDLDGARESFRLAAAGLLPPLEEKRVPMHARERLTNTIERRTLEFEARLANTGDTLTFDGYASLFDTPYEMYGGPEKGGWTETVDPKAFDVTLGRKPDVVLNINHGAGGTGLPIARTSSGTLQLRADKKGLNVRSVLDVRDPDVQLLQVKMGRGDLDGQMSFAFRTIRQEWNDDESERRLLEVSLDRGDVSIVTNGAQPATTSTLRGLPDVLDVLANLDDEELALAEVRALDDPIVALEAAQRTLSRLTQQIKPAGRRISVKFAEQLSSVTA